MCIQFLIERLPPGSQLGMDLRRLSEELVPFSCHLGEFPCAPPLSSVSGHGLVFFAVSPVVQEPSSLGFSARISHFQV